MKTFLQPLSAIEEKEYFERYHAGDKEAGNLLVERNLRLVAHIARKYANTGEEPEDLISIGTIGLMKAVATFDCEKGNRLVTYAARCIDNELLMMLRTRKKIAKDVSLYEPIGTDKEGNEISLLDVTPDLSEDIADTINLSDNVKRIRASIREVLSDSEREIIELRFGLDGKKECTQREIGDKLGISRSYVSRIEKRALAKLRESYEWEL